MPSCLPLAYKTGWVGIMTEQQQNGGLRAKKVRSYCNCKKEFTSLRATLQKLDMDHSAQENISIFSVQKGIRSGRNIINLGYCN